MANSMLAYYVVDAFTNQPFSGNPAAVVPLESWPRDEWLQNVAMEMNLSETAYLVRNDTGFDLRWFTPKAEVDLCGHATLASALVLAETGQLDDLQTVAFDTRSGSLIVERAGANYILDFPALSAISCEPPEGLLEALGVQASYIGLSKMDVLVEVESEEVVRQLAPDFKALSKINCRGVIVTARSKDSRFDFVSRFFAPAVGVDEDPVTGSAHCLLTPYWKTMLNKSKMTAAQISSRGGVLDVELAGDRVKLAGQGIIFSQGQIRVGHQAVPTKLPLHF